jgi:hypothetical protein
LAAQPAQDDSDVSLRICSRDTIRHLLSDLTLQGKALPSHRGKLAASPTAQNWRRGQESNLPRLLRTDSGFEDREDHQAPFTLPKEEKENTEGSTSNAERPISEKE